LNHQVSTLIGRNIEDIMVTSSRESIRRLIRDVVNADKRASGCDEQGVGGEYYPPIIDLECTEVDNSAVGEEDVTSDSSSGGQQQVASTQRKRVLHRLSSSGTSFESSESTRSIKRGKYLSSDNSGGDHQESNKVDEQTPEAEDHNTSSAESSSRGSRPVPLAPACDVCLIRSDLSTIWCELTSSIRTRPSKIGGGAITDSASLLPEDESSPEHQGEQVEEEEEQEEEKELLLCFRPLREGEQVGEELRFVPKKTSAES